MDVGMLMSTHLDLVGPGIRHDQFTFLGSGPASDGSDHDDGTFLSSCSHSSFTVFFQFMPGLILVCECMCM
jgi:hypothetical protein